MTMETSLALEVGKILFRQSLSSGETIVSDSALELIHCSESSHSIDFYCKSKRISIPIQSISSFTHGQGCAIIESPSFACKIFINLEDARHHEYQFDKIVLLLEAILSTTRSTATHPNKSVDDTYPSKCSLPPKPQTEFTQEALGESSSKGKYSNSNNSNNKTESTKSKPNPPSPLHKKHHSDNEAMEIIKYASIAHAFQATHVLEKIVESEIERIKKEKAVWKVAGAVAGLAVGVPNGFQFTDLFTSMAFSNIGGMAHDFASKEQVEFLKKAKSDWLVSQKSALEICHKLGMPRQRSICYFADSGKLCIANLHENPSRGTFIVPMGAAKDHAIGFKNDDSLSVLYNTFEESEINILGYQLYPMELLAVSSLKRISLAKAVNANPYHHLLNEFNEVSELTFKGQADSVIAYKVHIPLGSDY